MELPEEILLALLEALHIAKQTTVGIPPMETNRLFLSFDKAFQHFGNEALARGITGYAELQQFEPLDDEDEEYVADGYLQSGEKLDENSEIAAAMEFDGEANFWRKLQSKITLGIIAECYADRFDAMEVKERVEMMTEIERRIQNILENESIEGVIDLKAIAEKIGPV